MKRRNAPIDTQSLDKSVVLDKWVARSRWWSNDEKRLYLRLHTARGIIEVYKTDRQWYVSRVAD
jgi:hypothetical protein